MVADPGATESTATDTPATGADHSSRRGAIVDERPVATGRIRSITRCCRGSRMLSTPSVAILVCGLVAIAAIVAGAVVMSNRNGGRTRSASTPVVAREPATCKGVEDSACNVRATVRRGQLRGGAGRIDGMFICRRRNRLSRRAQPDRNGRSRRRRNCRYHAARCEVRKRRGGRRY